MLGYRKGGGQAGGIWSGGGAASDKTVPPRGASILKPSNASKSHGNPELLFEGSGFPAQLTKADLGFGTRGNTDENRSALNLNFHAADRLRFPPIQRHRDAYQRGRLPHTHAVRVGGR